MIDDAFEGEHEVSRADIRRFSNAIGALDPVHHDVRSARERGFRDLVAPAAYYSALGLGLGRDLPATRLRADGLPADDEVGGRVVAGGTSVEWCGDIVAGDVVAVSQRLADVRRTTRADGEPLTISTYERTYRVLDRPVAVERYTRISRS